MTQKLNFILFVAILIVGTTFGAQNSYAQCTGPTSIEGGIDYDTTIDDLIVCDGTNWQTAGYTVTGLWTNNANSINYESQYIIKNGQTSTTALLDGDGIRSFYDSTKGAFRGGAILGGSAAWQNTNVGAISFAWGTNVQATGSNSIALGDNSTASGSGAIAMGTYSNASGNFSFTTGGDGTASGGLSVSMGSNNLASGFSSMAIGNAVTAGNGVAQSTSGNSDVGNYSVGFGLGIPSTGDYPRVISNQAFGVFFGDQESSTVTDENVFALKGGQLLIDSIDNGTDTEFGCIQYNDTANQLEWSNDCEAVTPTYTAFGGGGAINDLSDGLTNAQNNLYLGEVPASIGTNNIGNTATGITALDSITNTGSTGGNGDYNTAFGFETGTAVTSGYNNALFGAGAGFDITTGYNNTLIGVNAMYAATTGHHNVAVGHEALGANTGQYNVGIGASAIPTGSGGNNIALGSFSLASLTSGFSNIAVGEGAGDNITTGDSNIMIGNFANPTTPGTGSQLNIGNTLYGDLSNNFVSIGNASPATLLDVGTNATMRMTLNNSVATNDDPYSLGMQTATNSLRRFTLATEEGTNRHALQFGDGAAANTVFGLSWSNDSGTTYNPSFIVQGTGEIGIGTISPNVELDVIGDIEYTGVITDVSDRRLKENIEALSTSLMLDQLLKVKTYSFQMIDRKETNKDRHEYGVIAQEMEEIFPELVHTDDTTDQGYKSVNYVGLIAPIIESVKELYAKVISITDRVTTLETENAALKTEVDLLKQQNEQIMNRLDAIENDTQASNDTLDNAPSFLTAF